MCVALTLVCGTRACMALACAHLRVQDMTRAHLKIKCKEKNGTFHAYYPPAVVCCSYVFECNQYTCIGMSPFVSLCIRMLLECTRMLLVCTRMSLVCTRMYSYVERNDLISNLIFCLITNKLNNYIVFTIPHNATHCHLAS